MFCVFGEEDGEEVLASGMGGGFSGTVDGGTVDSVTCDSGPEMGESIVSGTAMLSRLFRCTRDSVSRGWVFVFAVRAGSGAN